MLRFIPRIAVLFLCCLGTLPGNTQSASKEPRFNVIAFYTAKNDQAHISFVHEANQWFPKMGETYGFHYDSTADWNNLNADFLARYQVVLFLDTRP